MPRQSRPDTRAGRWITQLSGDAAFRAFVPNLLPPVPAVNVDAAMQSDLERASRALGLLEGVTQLLPDPDFFVQMYARKEALLSSQIEGTQSTLSELLVGERLEDSSVDVREVLNCDRAMRHGLRRLDEGFPLSLRLIREIHGALVDGARGANQTPGEFRKSQNWVGGSSPANARYVPPPVHEMTTALANLEMFVTSENDPTPLLIRAGVAHAQFETIHPFLDGNGRVGRLLITLLLVQRKALSQPLLYLSLYLKAHRDEYYDCLQRIRTHGEWEQWLRFYLRGVAEVGEAATKTARSLVMLFERDRSRVHDAAGRSASHVLKAHEMLKRRVVVTIPDVAKAIKVTYPTADSAMKLMIRLKIARELPEHSNPRVFSYREYMALLAEGTEVIGRSH